MAPSKVKAKFKINIYLESILKLDIASYLLFYL